MYLQNKYTKWYNNIIHSALARVNHYGYTEKHHIIPKCLGGTNNKDNIVRLTAKEHFICHRLLCKMTTSKAKQKMVLACKMLTRLRNQIRISSRTFEIIREDSRKAHSIDRLGKPSPLKGLPGIPHTNGTKQKLREANLGKKHNDETKKKISESLKGKTLSEITKEKMRKPKSSVAVEKSRLIWKALSSRPIVFECRALAKDHGVVLGRGWARRSDEWIINKITEMKSS